MFENIQNYSQRTVTLNFAAAVTDYELEFDGERIWVRSATAEFDLKLDRRSDIAKTMSAKKGLVIPFKRLFITTTGANDIVLFLSNPASVRFEESEVNVDSIDKLEKTLTLTYGEETIAAAATLIIAANTGRKALTIYNGGAESLFIGGDNLVTILNGLTIPFGQGFTLDRYTGAVYGICASGGLDCRYFEEG